jgi:DNA helicase-2/ATP-dependent DNA helicase PcrA
VAIDTQKPSFRAADAPLPARESYSSLTTYEGCPRRYAFRYVERLPGEVPPGQFAFGSAIHKAFEVFVRERIRARADGAPEPHVDLLRRACDEVLERAGLEPDELARMRAAAGPVLERFVRREAADTSVPVAAELGFGLDVALPADAGSVRFVGYIDRVDRTADGTTVITDYKTGRPRAKAEVDVDRQLTAYAYAADRGALRDPATGDVVPPASRLCLYFADGTEVFTARSASDLMTFEGDLVAMATKARQRDFDAQPAPWRCRWCEYRGTCGDAIVNS